MKSALKMENTKHKKNLKSMFSYTIASTPRNEDKAVELGCELECCVWGLKLIKLP